MKFGLYPRLALAGIRKNKRLYIPYLLTCTGMAMMYYIIIFLQHNEMLDGMRGGTTASTILALGGWVVAIFACIFLFYTHSFLLRRRKKEFGLYNILGMGRRHLVRIEIWETIFVAIGTTAAGLLCGIAFSKLAELGLMNLMHGSISYVFSISAPAIMATLLILGSFTCCFCCGRRSRWDAPRLSSCCKAKPPAKSPRAPIGFWACWALSCWEWPTTWQSPSRSR